jgi:hypothetical protein
MSAKGPIYVLRLRASGDERSDIHALRAILKALLRRWGWRCISISEERVSS